MDSKTAIQIPSPSVHSRLFKLMGLLFKPHPWHGLEVGDRAPEVVTAYVECVPGEGLKYEVNKSSGYLHVDRPHKFSSLCPTIYGFIPQTLSGPKTAARCRAATNIVDIKGDNDPMDICVLSYRPITRGDLTMQVRPIGGLRMIDKGEADDKIIAILESDATMSGWVDIHDVPAGLLSMIKHYFLTYKQDPDAKEKAHTVTIPQIYGRDEDYAVIKSSMEDYADQYKTLKADFADALVDHLKSDLAITLLSSPSRHSGIGSKL